MKFQSTPPCGGDELVIAGDQRSPNFNPRPLAGATAGRDRQRVSQKISIHAPLRGRRFLPLYRGSSIYFNPRPLAGATSNPGVDIVINEFQSTPPCGGDESGSPGCRSPENFNPRPLAGATKIISAKKIAEFISIHAPLRGRRRKA